MNKNDYDLEYFKTLLKQVLFQNQTSLSENMYSPKYQDYNTLLSDKKNAPPLEVVNRTEIGGIWTLKHEISSPKFYEIIIETELKGDTDMELNNL